MRSSPITGAAEVKISYSGLFSKYEFQSPAAEFQGMWSVPVRKKTGEITETELTRLKTIERAGERLLAKRGDLGLIGLREDIVDDIAKAYGPFDPKQHKTRFP